jgi:hypothetical protein
LATIKSHFNVPSNPVTTNGDCLVACDGTTQVGEIVVTTTTQVEEIVVTTTLPQVVAPVQMSESLQTAQPEPVVNNTEPYTSPITTTTTVVESVNVASAFVAPVLTQKFISPISKTKACKPKACKPKVIKSNKGKKVLTKIK